MYKVIFRIPAQSMRTLIMSENEFRAWIKHRFLRGRIVSWEKML